MAFTINKATGTITGAAIRLSVNYTLPSGVSGYRILYAYKIIGKKGEFTFSGASAVSSPTELTPAIMAAAIGKAWRTGLSTANENYVKTASGTHYAATLKFSINGTGYASERILNPAAYQSAKTTLAGFPSGAGQGAVNVGRFFGDPRNPRNYGLFTPDGRRIGN